MAYDTNGLVVNPEKWADEGSWKLLSDDAEVPAYVRAALANDKLGQIDYGITPEQLKTAKIGQFTLNGQTNYGFELPNWAKTSYSMRPDDSGNIDAIQESAPTDTRFAIQVPLSSSNSYVPDDLAPIFYGQKVNGSDKPAYTFGDSGASPTSEMLDQARQTEVSRRPKGGILGALPYLAPLFPIGVGLGAGALGGAGALSALGGAESIGTLGAGAAGAAEGVGAAGSLGSLVPGSTISMFPAGSSAVSGAIGGGEALGSAAPAVAGAAAPAATAPAASGGFLSSAYNALQGAVTSGLGTVVSPEMAASLAPAVTKGILGAGGGALASGLTGGNPLTGALTGGIGGAAIGAFGGASGPLAQALGVGGGTANALIGAGTGALGSSLSGGNPIMGALAGGAGGYLSSYLPDGTPTPGGIDPSVLQQTGNATTSSTPAAGGVGAAASDAAGLFGKKGISGTALALGALAAGVSALGGKPQQVATSTTGSTTTPGPESVQGALGPYFNQGLNKDVLGRQTNNPWAAGVPNYWTYGGPEQSYFNNNSLRSFGFADGGAAYPTDDGREFSTEYGDSHVRGPGDGESDSIAARLSDGEYVLTAREVSDIGHGDNEQGALKLDKWRKSGVLSRMLANL